MTPPSDNPDHISGSNIHLVKNTQVGHYRIIEKIGAGGMGEIYLAEDTKLNRQVALKFLPSECCRDEEIRTRFQREAQAAAKLSHPNIITIYEINEFQGRPFFAMEHIEGLPLDNYIKEKKLPLNDIINLSIQIVEGLADAHRGGITHRDIKPSNIVVDRNGHLKILDFGLATIKGVDKLTKAGSTLGTLHYMSPEQARGEEPDHRSDIFSFGVVLYEMITGQLPFKGDHEPAIIYSIGYEEPEPLARYKSGVPDELQRIENKALAKDRNLRYQHADDLLADLKSFIREEIVPVGEKHRPDLWNRYVVTSAIALLLIVAGFWMANKYILQTSEKPKSGEKMVAVLPFENLGPPEDEYFADGMTEEITSRLAGISGLGVISRTSAMKYKRTDEKISQIGKELGVDYILEGSVRWSKTGGQSKVRIAPQLIRVSDDRHIWADNYERAMIEVFAVQEEIATKIVDQLGLTLGDSERKTLASRPTANSKAYDYYLKGISGVRRQDWTFANLLPTTANLDSAVILDSTFALAYALRSEAYTTLAFQSQSADHKRIAKESFEKAFRLQPGISYAHRAAGLYYNLIETDYDRAVEEYSQAKSELRNDADLLSEIGFVQLRQGKCAEAQENARRATELDPLNASMYDGLCWSLRYTRSFREAEQSIDRAIALEPRIADYWLLKKYLYISRYGDWNKIEPVIRDALAHCDTLEFAMNAWWEIARLHDMPFDSLLNRYRKEYRSKPDTLNFFSSVVLAYYAKGDSTMMKIYLDSARIYLEKSVKKNPNDPHRTSGIGLVFSFLGRCEEAIKWGKRGKELLSLAKCHW